MKNRLFTFGCSFTQYVYPTWVDFLALNTNRYDEVHNFGRSGAGNKYILAALLSAMEEHQIGFHNDTVAVMFSSCVRYDYMSSGNDYITSGNFFNSKTYRDHPEAFKEMWSLHTGILDAWVGVESFIRIVEGLGCNFLPVMSAFGKDYSLLEYNAPDHLAVPGTLESSSIKDRFLQWLPDTNLRDFSIARSGHEKYTFDPIPPNTNQPYIDGHPSIMDHCGWVEKELSDWFSPEFWDKAQEWEDTIIKKGFHETRDAYFNHLNKTNLVLHLGTKTFK